MLKGGRQSFFLRFELVSGYFFTTSWGSKNEYILLPQEVVKTGFSGFFCVHVLEGSKKTGFER